MCLMEQICITLVQFFFTPCPLMPLVLSVYIFVKTIAICFRICTKAEFSFKQSCPFFFCSIAAVFLSASGCNRHCRSLVLTAVKADAHVREALHICKISFWALCVLGVAPLYFRTFFFVNNRLALF